MSGRFSFPLVFALGGLFAALAAPLRGAKPILIPDTGGQVTLPTSGLSVSLPAQPGVTYKVTGRWGLSNGGKSYWSRDIIDEFDAEDNLTAGNWVSIGYFDAGEAAAVIKDVKLTEDWETTADLWGLHWHVRGGNYTFTSSLGVKPALVLATTPSKLKPSILLYRYFLKEGEANLSHDDMIAAIRTSPTLNAAFQSYWAEQCGPVLPTKSEAVNQPANGEATRVVRLPRNGLQMRLPDDGFVWLEETKPENELVDLLYRMAPRLPDLTIELLLNEAPGVRAAFTKLGLDKNPWDPAPANLPAGWESGPTITTSDGVKETTVGTVIGSKVLIVGFMVTPRLIDVGPYQPLLASLADAVVHPAPLPAPPATPPAEK